jgi:hypothetical protein
MNRLISNWYTSVMGLVVFALACYLLYAAKVDHVGFAALVTLALTLFRAKDSLIGLPAK